MGIRQLRGLKSTSSGGNLKSNVSDLLEVAQSIYLDACARCIADVSDLRDLKTMRSRVEREGVSFLTITLPQFAKDFERSLANGYIDPTFFRSFKKNGSIPAFLQGMIGRLFDKETGRINDESSGNSVSDHPSLVDSVRQVCLAFKKLELPCTLRREHAAIANFVDIERSFQEFVLSEEDAEEFQRVSFCLWNRVIQHLRVDMLRLRHGPGNTADRILGNQKFHWRTWHERLEPYFPLLDSAYSVSAFESEVLQMVSFVQEDQELPVRVTTVPKTLKGPRVIAMEPSCMQYAQHGIQDVLQDAIESHRISKGHVNFRDQSINRSLALDSSSTGRLATIDLSDASDRVPRSLALSMFDSNPDLRDAIDACRSTRALLPDGNVLSPLQKFASMGSALCFPVEAMYFYTICVKALLRHQNLPVTFGNCFIVSRDVYIYGDDILVPSIYANIVLEELQKYNCKPNTSKTFWTGKFRESCGMDAYDGTQVTPVYVNTLRPRNKRQASELISWTATSNLFYAKGYWRTAQFMFEKLESVLGDFPYVSEKSPALGRVSLLGYRSAGRWNSKLHRFEVKAWVPRPVYRTDPLSDYPALQKCLQSLENQRSSVVDKDQHHLERTALHGTVALKRRWVSAHY